MENKKFEELMEKVKIAGSVYPLCDQCQYNGKNNCLKSFHRDVGVLIDEFAERLKDEQAKVNNYIKESEQMRIERDALERRLKHLLQSETIRQFDAISPRDGDYERDITELDEMIKGSAQKEAIDALFKKIAKNCENELSADEIKKHVECFDHLRQACKGLFTKMYW